MISKAQLKISVIVCSYGRVGILKKAIQSLLVQTLDKNLYEIIIVDNFSSPKLDLLVVTFRKSYKLPLIDLVVEKKQGLGYARNKGVEHAQGQYIAFLDDDAQADKKWLETALGCFKTVDSKPVAVGGPIFPIYKGSKPSWFKDRYEIRNWGEEPRFLKKGETFSGSNMILDKDIVNKFAGFDTQVGMKGELLSLGEETSLFTKIWQNTKNVNLFYYQPKLIVYHLVTSKKMTVSYQLKRSFAAGQSFYQQSRTNNILTYTINLIKYFIGFFAIGVFAIFSFFQHKRWQNWAVEELSPVFYSLGFLSKVFRLNISLKR